MADITLLPSAKVPLIYQGDTMMTTEWYRFFWNLYGFTGTGVVPVNKGGTGLDTIGNHQLIIGNTNGVFEPALLSSSSINISYPAGFVNLEIGNSTVTPGTYGSSTQVGVFTVNQYGILTAASDVLIGIDANQIISGTLAVARGGTGQNSYTNGQLLIGNTSGNTLTKATLTAGTGITITNGAGAITIAATSAGGTVTSVAALTLGTIGTDLSSTVANPTTTPVITLNVPTASAANRGALSSADWTTFNSKQAALVSGVNIKTVNGTTLLGSGDVGTINTGYGGTGLTATPTNGQLLIGNGTGYTLSTLTAGAGVTITNGSGSISIAAIGGNSITSYAYTATAGQTVFTGLSYTPGNNGLSVYVNGSKQLVSVNYIETNTTTVTFTSGLNVGDVVEMEVIAAIAGLSGVTGVTGTAPIVSSGGATPAISIPAATSSVNGYLTSTDWSTFNNKASTALATATVAGLIELGSDTVQTVAANAVSATASRSYALQVNAAGQGVINVPWTDTNSGGTVTSVGGTGTVNGLTLTGTVTTSGNLTLGGTLSGTAASLSIGGNAATATSSPLLSALGLYVWTVGTLPSGYNLGIQTSFVDPTGWPSYGSVITTKTYSGGGGSLQMYVPYSPTFGGTGMQVRFGNYDVSSGNSWTSWKTLLASDNYNSYAPTLTGTGASGTWGISVSGNAATATTATNQSGGTVSATSVSTSGTYTRTAAGKGYLDGNYSSSETYATSGAIYSIGSAYPPGTSNLGTMYGIGYTYSGYAAGNPGGVPTNIWGMYVASGGTARIFLDADSGAVYAQGKVYVNTASAAGNGVLLVKCVVGVSNGLVSYPSSSGSYNPAVFLDSGLGQIGAISCTTTTTSFVTSSDFRLKDDLGIATSTDVIDNTLIHDYKWKQNGVVDRGVFAQEAQLVKPLAITEGTDEINEKGLPIAPWGVDYSKYVPDLIVYCQQLNARIKALETQLKGIK